MRAHEGACRVHVRVHEGTRALHTLWLHASLQIDTGVRRSHQDLNANIVDGWNRCTRWLT